MEQALNTGQDGYRFLDAILENNVRDNEWKEIFLNVLKNGVRIENVHHGTCRDTDRDIVLRFLMSGKTCDETAELAGMSVESVCNYSRLLGFTDCNGDDDLLTEDMSCAAPCLYQWKNQLKFPKNVAERRSVAIRLGELTGNHPYFTKAPHYAYMIGDYWIDREGNLLVEEDKADAAVLNILLGESLIRNDSGRKWFDFYDKIENEKNENKKNENKINSHEISFREATLPADYHKLNVIENEMGKMQQYEPVSKKPVRVAAYIRVSTDHENQEDSYELQERYFTQLLWDNPEWISAGVYSDYGISATGHANRRGFNRLIRHCKEGKIDRIICKSISRFARNTSDFMDALSVLNDYGVSMYFEKENLDTACFTNEFILTTLGAIAQEESRNISENQKWGIRSRMQRSELQNKEMYGYRFAEGEDAFETLDTGYRIRRIEVVEHEAAIVRRIFDEYISGRSCNSIARGLNIDCIPPPSRHYISKKNFEKAVRILSEANGGTPDERLNRGWTGKRVLYIIKQVRYTGNILAQMTYVESYITHKCVRNDGMYPQYYIRNHHPAIITEEIFCQAEQIRMQNSNMGKFGNKAKPLPFSGIIYCGRCGKVYNVRNSGYNPIWFCPNASDKCGSMRCSAEHIYESQLIQMFRKAVIERFAPYDSDIRENRAVSDLQSGGFSEKAFSDSESKGFIGHMISCLMRLQSDNVEKDRAYAKRKICVLRMEKKRAQSRVEFIKMRIKMADILRDTIGDTFALKYMEKLQKLLVDSKIEEARAKKRVEKEETNLLRQELYWEETEANYLNRQKTIEWMKTLSDDSKGMVEFLNGLKTEHVRAFVLGVVVFDPMHFCVRWYDNATSEVVLFSNADEGWGIWR